MRGHDDTQTGKMLEDSTSTLLEASAAVLPRLPQEVLDMIIFSSFDIALLHDPEALDYRPLIRNIFTSPFFRVNRACRQSATNQLADRFVWIEVVSYENEDFPATNEGLRHGIDSLFHHVPVLDQRFVNLIPGQRTSILFELNRFLLTTTGETASAVTTRQFVFPFQYESMLRFVVDWRHHWQLRCMSIEVSCNNRTATGLVGEIVSQATELVQFLRFSPKAETIPSSLSSNWTSLLSEETEIFAASALEDCESVLAHVKQLDAWGMAREADIFAHYYLPTLYDHVLDVVSGERAIFLQDLSRHDWMENQQNKIRVLLQQQYLLCQLAATRALQRIWTIPSLRRKWLEPEQVGDRQLRWRPPWYQEPGAGFFGVPDCWMAAWHYYTGLACADEAFAVQELTGGESLDSVTKLGYGTLPLTRRAAIELAIGYLWSAEKLEPDEQRYQYAYNRLIALVEQKHMDTFSSWPDFAAKRMYVRLDGTRRRYWIGGSVTGAETALLPRAQSFAVQELTMLNEMMEFQDAKGVGYVEWSLRSV